MTQVLSAICVVLGFLFVLLATVGLLKFPDFFTRMAAVSKASTLGLVFFMLGAGFAHADFWVWIKVVAIIIFFFLAAPIAAHLLGRSAYKRNVRLYIGTLRDDYKGSDGCS